MMKILRYIHLSIFFLSSLSTLGRDPGIPKEDFFSDKKSTLYLLENAGQITDQHRTPRTDIDFKVSGGGVNVFIGDGQLHYQWYKLKEEQPEAKPSVYWQDKRDFSAESYRMDVVLVGANKHATLLKEEKQSYYETYYLANIHGNKAESYAKVIYQDIYPNIDWVIYSDGTGLKYDFVVRPGGKVSDIKLRYEGVTNISLVNGKLTATTPLGEVKENAPYSYEATSSKEIVSSFRLNENEVTFEVEDYQGTLVIDPVLNWEFFGSDVSSFTFGYTGAADTSGKPYICGATTNVSNIATIGAFQYVYNGGDMDGYIRKCGTNGIVLWATYYGGEAFDQIIDATVDLNDNLYVTGLTMSFSGMTTTGSHQEINVGDTINGKFPDEAFLAKFTSAGQIQWATYYGYKFRENGKRVRCDNEGNVYLAGFTTSYDSAGTSIATTNGFRRDFGPGFLVKFNAAGVRLWGTFYNGGVLGLTCNNDTTLYIAGYTDSVDGIATSGAHQFLLAGSTDGYIAKFTTAGQRLWATYYGGTGEDLITNIVSDSFQNVYTLGFTTSTTGLTTANAWIPSPGRGYLGKFNKDGTRVWGTYYPISPFIDLEILPDGKLLMMSLHDVVRISKDGYHVSSFKVKYLRDPRFDPLKDGAIFYSKKKYYLVSCFSHNGIGYLNGYLAQYEADTAVYIKFPYTDTSLCAGGSFDLKYGVVNDFRSGNTFTVQLSNAAGSFSSAVTIGSATVNNEGVIKCIVPVGTPEGTGYKLRIMSDNFADTFYNYDVPIKVWKYYKPDILDPAPLCMNSVLELSDISGAPFATVNYKWTGPTGAMYSGNHWVLGNVNSSAYDGDYIVEIDNHGCKASDTLNVKLLPSPPNPIITGDTTLCIGDTLHLTASIPDTTNIDYQWLDPARVLVPQTQSIIVNNVQPIDGGLYEVRIRFRDGCASAQPTKMVRVHSLPQPTAGSNASLCLGDSIKLNGSDTMQGVNYSWSGPNNFRSSAKDISFVSYVLTQSGEYVLTNTSSFGCTEKASTNIIVKPVPEDVDAFNNGPLCSGDSLQLTCTNTTEGVTYLWSGPAGYNSTLQSPVLGASTVAMSGEYKIVVDIDGCSKTGATKVEIYQRPDTPQASANTPLSIGSILKLVVTNPQTGVQYSWLGPEGFLSTQQDPVINSITLKNGGKYVVTATVGVCSSTDTITIVITEQGDKKDRLLLVLPNPNNGMFKLVGKTTSDVEVPIHIFASDGKLVYIDQAKPKNNIVDHTIDISGKVASGIYHLKMKVDGELQTIPITIVQ